MNKIIVKLNFWKYDTNTKYYDYYMNGLRHRFNGAATIRFSLGQGYAYYYNHGINIRYKALDE